MNVACLVVSISISIFSSKICYIMLFHRQLCLHPCSQGNMETFFQEFQFKKGHFYGNAIGKISERHRKAGRQVYNTTGNEEFNHVIPCFFLYAIGTRNRMLQPSIHFWNWILFDNKAKVRGFVFVKD